MFSKGKLSRFLFNEPGPKCAKLRGFGLHSLLNFFIEWNIPRENLPSRTFSSAQLRRYQVPATALQPSPPSASRAFSSPHWASAPYIPPLRLRQKPPPATLLSVSMVGYRGLMKVGHTAAVFLGLAEFPLFLHLYLDFYFFICFKIKALTGTNQSWFSKWTCCAKLAKDTTTSHRLQTLLPLQGWSFAHELKPLYWPWLGSGRALFSIIIIYVAKESKLCWIRATAHVVRF